MNVHDAHRIPISSYGGTAGATLLWRRGGQLRVTIILKVQLALIPDDLALIAPGAEIHHADSPADTASPRALEIPSDMVPAGGAEVLLAGHACAPTGRTVNSLSVRLFLGRDETSVLDKTVHVYGDRLKSNAVPQPFSRIPLVYQRAVGGPNTDNPVGRPLNDASHPPNVVNPLDPWVVAGFGPIAPTWPMRQRLARIPPVSNNGILEVPDDLPLEYFSVAPRDQRIPAIAGDEWIIVDGMHPDLGRFQSQLPKLLARARLSRQGDKRTPGVEVGLSIARLAIDMDRVRAELTWRGSVALDPADLPFVHVIGGIEQQAEPIEEAPEELMTETMMLNEDQIRDALYGRELPWRPPHPSERSAEPASAARTPRSAVKPMIGLPFGNASRPERNAPTFGPPPTGAPSLHVAPEIREAAPERVGPIPSVPTPTPSHDLFQNDVTITSIDESILNVLPFGKGSHGASAFDVPRMTDDDSDDIGGQTAVTPVMNAVPRNALPFMPSGQRAATRVNAPRPAPGRVAPAPAPAAPPTSQSAIPSGLPFSASGPSAVPALFGSSVEPPARADSSALPSLSTAIDMPVVTDLPDPSPSPPESPDTDGPATLSEAEPNEESVSPEVVVAVVEPDPQPAEPKPAEATETGVRKTVLDNVRAGTAMHGMDLASADLSNLDLSGAILADAKLSGARLTNTILRNARLSGAKLMGADLRGANLTEANLTRADLTRATLTDAIFTKADLSDANASLVQAGNTKLEDIKADRASFVQAHLERAVLDRASLRDCDFSGAFLAHASFREVAASGARFAETRGENAVFDAAKLDGAIFTGANLEDASFTNVQAARSNWERAALDRAVFDRATITDATFARASLEVASFLSSNLTKTDLSNISADGADFSESKLIGCDLRMSKLSDARLEKANLREVNAQKTVANGARFEGADLQKASLRGARLKGSDLANTQLDGADLRDADLENAKLDGVDVTKAKLGGANLKGAVGL